MDDQTGKKLEEISEALKENNTALSALGKTIDTHVAYSEGLDLPGRMKGAEDEIKIVKDEKASWKGLYTAVVLIIAIVTVVMAIASHSAK